MSDEEKLQLIIKRRNKGCDYNPATTEREQLDIDFDWLTQKAQIYQEALRFYADESMYVRYLSVLDGLTSDIDFDGGGKARVSLDSDDKTNTK